MSTQEEREEEVLSLMRKALDPDHEYDGSDAMSHPEGDKGGDD